MFTSSLRHAAHAWRSPRRWVPALALALLNAAAIGLNAHAQQPLTLAEALRLAVKCQDVLADRGEA